MKRSVLITLALALLLSACGTAPSGTPAGAPDPQTVSEPSGEEPPPDDEIPQPDLDPEPEENPEDPEDTPEPSTPPATELAELAAREAAGRNPDVVGWLQVPGTDIDEAVAQSDDNNYYLRRTLDGDMDINGCYYADYRCILNGDLSPSTVIYGNSASDDPDAARFSQLNRYRDEQFARDNRIIRFATTERDYEWEVFAVTETDVQVPYNVPTLDPDEWLGLMNALAADSQHDFGVQIRPDDRVLVLSTVCYISGTYPNEDRFVVLARLAD